MSKTKKLSSLIAMAVLAGSVAGGGTAWASGDILIGSTGATTYDGETNPYSGTSYVGVDGQVASIIEGAVDSIKTADVVESSSNVGGIVCSTNITVASIFGGINVTAAAEDKDVYGIYFGGSSDIQCSIAKLGSISATQKGSTGTVYGICTSTNYPGSFSSEISFAEGGTITATADNSEGSVKAYGLSAKGYGTHKVTNLGSIQATGNNGSIEVMGIEVNGNANTSCGFTADISFSGSSSVQATHKGSTGSVAGISISDVFFDPNQKPISSEISFAEGSTITATADNSGGSVTVYGIYAKGSSSASSYKVTNLGSIQATSKGSGTVYGIYVKGKNYTTNISFKGSGSNQAITATAGTADKAYSIYDCGTAGTTNISFENCILSGRISHTKSSTLNLSFGSGGKWQQKYDDLTGTVSVNFDEGGTWKITDTVGAYTGTANVTLEGGTLDTRADTTAQKDIDLGNYNITAESGSTVSFDAVLSDNSVTSDKLTTTGTISGTIALGTVNLTGKTTDAWELGDSRETTLFSTTGTGTNTLKITGTTVGTSDGYGYTFSQAKEDGNEKPGVLSVLKGYGGTLPEIVQGKENLGKFTSYSLVDDYEIPSDMGTLNNSQRSGGFTIYGNGFILSANGYGGVTINSGAKMTVKTLEISGFKPFATNSGTLELTDVTFTKSADSDVVNNGTLNLTGEITLDKGIIGSGTTYITGDTTLKQNSKTAAELMQNTTVKSGATLSGSLLNKSGVRLTNEGTLGTEGGSDTLTNEGMFFNKGTVYSTVENSGTLYLMGSTTTGSVSGSGRVEVFDLNNTVSGDFSAKALNCCITPTDMNAAGSNTMLNVSGTANLDNATVKAGVYNVGTVAAGDKITLVKAGTLKASGMTTGTFTDGFMEVDLDIAQDGNSITATVKGGGSAGEDAKSPVETQAAVVSLVNSGADMMAGEAMQSASAVVANERAAGNATVMTPFASAGGSSMRLNSGSHVDTKSWNIAVGFAKEVENANGKFMFGPVIEYGKGSYDSYLDNGTHGDGTSSFFGIGFVAKQEYKSNLYVEGSIRGGHSENDYSAIINGTDNSYDSSSNYFGAHLGVGKVVPIGEKDNIDYYCKLFYTYQAGSDATLKSGHRYDFDAVNSFRTKLGFRYNHKLNPVSTLYAGLAWQHEFGSECNATVHTGDYSANAPAPSVKGDSGILELGCKFRTGDRLETGLGLLGSVGKQRGIGGHLEFKWIF